MFFSRVTAPVRRSHFFFSPFSSSSSCSSSASHHCSAFLERSASLFNALHAAFESSPSRSQSINVIHHHRHLQRSPPPAEFPRQSLLSLVLVPFHTLPPFMWSSPRTYVHSRPTFLSSLPTFLLPASFPSSSSFPSAAALIK